MDGAGSDHCRGAMRDRGNVVYVAVHVSDMIDGTSDFRNNI